MKIQFTPNETAAAKDYVSHVYEASIEVFGSWCEHEKVAQIRAEYEAFQNGMDPLEDPLVKIIINEDGSMEIETHEELTVIIMDGSKEHVTNIMEYSIMIFPIVHRFLKNFAGIQNKIASATCALKERLSSPKQS